MVLITLIDISVKSVFWIGGKIYNGGYYLIYGPTKSKEEILTERIEEMKLRYDDEIQKLKDIINNKENNN